MKTLIVVLTVTLAACATPQTGPPSPAMPVATIEQPQLPIPNPAQEAEDIQAENNRVSAIVCDPSVTNPYLIMECAQRTDQAKAICLQSAGCTPPMQTYEQAKADADRRQIAAAQIETNRLRAISEAQDAYVSHQQRLAICTLGADAAALSINNFWGGLFAGLATGIVCMN